MRITGEATVETERDILTEFKVVAEFMKCIGVKYSMIVHVEAGSTAESNTITWNGPPAGEARSLGDQ